MGKKWGQVLQENPNWAPPQRAEAQDQYFNQVVAPQIPGGGLSEARAQFYKDFPLPQYRPTGQGAYNQEIIRMDAGHQARLQGDNKAGIDGGSQGYFANKFGPKNKMEQQREDYVNPFLAGMGGAMKQPYNWMKQGGANVLNDMGLMSDEYKAGVDKNVIEDKQMYENLTRQSAAAGEGGFSGDMAVTAPISTLAKTAGAIKNPYMASAGGGAVMSGTQVVEDPDNFYGKSTGNALIGIITGTGMTKMTKYFPERVKYRDTSIESAERRMKENIMGGSPGGTGREAGQSAGSFTKELKDMTKKEVTGLYEAAKKNYGNDVDIPTGGFLNALKVELGRTGKSPEGTDLRSVNSMVRAFVKENNAPSVKKIMQQLKSKEINAAQSKQMIDDLPQNKSVHQLDRLDKDIGIAWKKGNKSTVAEGSDGMVRLANLMRSSLEGSLKSHRAGGIFAIAKKKFETTKAAQSLKVGEKQISLNRFIDKAKPEEFSKDLFFKGSIDNVLKAKEIMLEGHTKIKGMDYKKGAKAWNDSRAHLFSEMLGFANPNVKGKKLVNPDKFQEMMDKLGPEKLEAIFSESERKIMKTIASVDDRTALEILKSTFGGPRMSWEGRMFREVGKILIKALFQSKESAGFARKVAEKLEIKPKYNILGDIASRTPFAQATGSVTRESIADTDHTMQLIKSMGRSAANATREALGAK